jgi:large subunit ribosomal protein L28e
MIVDRETRENMSEELMLIILEQAIGVLPGKDGGVTLLTKKSDKHHQPASSTQSTTFGAQRSTRKYVIGEK